MKAIRRLNLVFLVVSLCLLLAIPVLGIGSAMSNWHGMCYGFTDSQWECPFLEFAKNEMFWASFMFIPPLVMVLAAWLVFHVIRLWISVSRQLRKDA